MDGRLRSYPLQGILLYVIQGNIGLCASRTDYKGGTAPLVHSTMNFLPQAALGPCRLGPQVWQGYGFFSQFLQRPIETITAAGCIK